ncbi:MAG TPA: glycosyltransferase [Anaerolineaceae bacterium]|nr:glycosyltransferase [Anaerolineaceae bacterium]HPN53682.1 glycosyltransferase [Anaerolineaceae bacterium]
MKKKASQSSDSPMGVLAWPADLAASPPVTALVKSLAARLVQPGDDLAAFEQLLLINLPPRTDTAIYDQVGNFPGRRVLLVTLSREQTPEAYLYEYHCYFDAVIGGSPEWDFSPKYHPLTGLDEPALPEKIKSAFTPPPDLTPAPLITILVGNFNYGRFVGQTIQSVLEQDFKDFELIVVDNASTDHSDEVIRSFSDPRLRYIRNDRNLGATESGNKVLQLVRGKYFAFLCSDDYYLPGHLSQMMAAMEAHPECDLATTTFTGVDEHGAPLPITGPRQVGAYFGGRNEFGELLAHGCYLNLSSTLYRSAKIRQLGGFNGALHGGGDYEWFIRIAARNPNFAYLDNHSVAYRFHSSQMSHSITTPRRLQDRVEILERVLTFPDLKPLKGYETEALRLLYDDFFLSPPEEAAPYQARVQNLAQRLMTLNAPEGLTLPDAYPLVSVVIPITTSALRVKTLLGVVQQTYPNLELVLVSDNRDELTRLIDQVKSESLFKKMIRSKSIISTGSLPFSQAYNNALGHASGEWIAFLGDEIVWSPEHLMVLIATAQTYPEAISAFSLARETYYHYENDVLIVDKTEDPQPVPQDPLSILIAKSSPLGCYLNHRRVFEQLGGFNPELDQMEDWDWIIRLNLLGNMVWVALPTAELFTATNPPPEKRLNEHTIQRYQKIHSRYAEFATPAIQQAQQKLIFTLQQLLPASRPETAEVLQMILDAEDPAAFISAHMDWLDIDLLKLVEQLAASPEVRRNPQVSTAIGQLARFIRQVVAPRSTRSGPSAQGGRKHKKGKHH